MTPCLRHKIVGLCKWSLVFFSGLPITVQAARTVDTLSGIHHAGSMLLFAAIIAGAITATFIRTDVDVNIKHPTTAKIFIGLTFGLFASLFLSSRYNLDDFQMLLPAYFLASIGTPVMVYVVGIASDKESYALILEWIRRKFGVGQ